MYLFRKDKKVEIKQIKAAKEIGITQPTLSNILNGKVACRKPVAFSITKYIDKDAIIEDYFIKKGE